jgi:hypothetical protein
MRRRGERAARDDTARAVAVLATLRQRLVAQRPVTPEQLTARLADHLTDLLAGPPATPVIPTPEPGSPLTARTAGSGCAPAIPTAAPEVATVDAAGRAEAVEVDWARVSPTIFGSVRHLVPADAARRHQGAHYTSAEIIRRILDPLLLDELRAQLAAAGDDRAALHRLWDRLAAVRLFDPACGCGNFLIIGYQDLRAVEAELIARLGHPGPARVRLSQLYGIEIDACSAGLAHSALAVLGRRYADASRPTIVTGCALELDWAGVLPPGEQVVVAGNPPFHGHKERTAAQGRQLRAAWGGAGVRHLDYATGWFAQALRYFGGTAGRWAFVVTNSVVQGESVPALFRPVFAAGWRIAFAYRTFTWSAPAEGAGPAGVHVVIVGFGRPAPGGAAPRLYERRPGGGFRQVAARHINGYLADGPDVLVQPRRTPLSTQLPVIRAGSTGIDWNQRVVEPAQVAGVRADPVAARYLRRFVGGRELINDRPRWCLWMAGADFDPDDLRRSPVLADRVERVRAYRAAAARPATRRLAGTPHLFGEVRQPTGAYLAMPQTFTAGRSYATAARLAAEVIASVKLFTAPDPDGLLFALFSSAAFLTWQRSVGGRLKSDPSFSASLVWNTLPLPPLTPVMRADSVAAGAAVAAARALCPGVCLARQYAPGRMSAPLLAAHAELDALVDAAFGAAGRCPDEASRQRLLFTRYVDLTG